MKVLSEWDKSGQLKEKDKDLSKRKKMMLNLKNFRENKKSHLLILNLSKRNLKILSKQLMALTLTITKMMQMLITTDEVEILGVNQLTLTIKLHHHK